jgi:hypothetical protein
MTKAVEDIRVLLDGDLPSWSLLERYRPQEEWFLRAETIGSIHGINHEARVLVWQELLARLLIKDGFALDQEALRWAAVTHDTQRIDDGIDFPHGRRAAAWVRQQLQHTIPAPSLETVVYLCAWHVPPDRSAPAMTPELAVFKDADGLDRVRLGDLDPRLLRSDRSKQLLLPLAEALLEASEEREVRGGSGPFECVMAAAVELGLITAE